MDQKISYFEKEIALDLTKEQQIERANRLGEIFTEIKEVKTRIAVHEDQYKSEKKGLEGELKGFEQSRDKILQELCDKKFKQTSKVKQIVNYSTGMVETWYPVDGDDSQKLEERPMEAGEYQMTLLDDTNVSDIEKARNQKEEMHPEGQNPIEDEKL